MEEKLNKILELARTRDAINAELVELLGDESRGGGVADFQSEEQDEIVDASKRRGRKKGNKKTRQSHTCRKCGEMGHDSRTCRAEGNFNADKGTKKEFNVTEQTKADIEKMLAQGQGSAEIAELYGISIRQANKAIAETKGIDMP